MPFFRTEGIWRSPSFIHLWFGQTVSLLGSEITLIALPLMAVAILHATPAEMGVLVASETLPYLLIGIFAGVIVDRLSRRPIMIVADILRAGLLLSIPLAAVWQRLTMTQLYLVSFALGVLFVLFDAAYQSYLPTLIDRERLIMGNSRIEASRAAAQIAGPGLGGSLVAAISAPIALVCDVLSFIISALLLATIRAPEPAPAASNPRRSIRREIGEGLQVVWNVPLLRDTTISSAFYNIAGGATGAIYFLYATQDLAFSPLVLGIVFAAGNSGFLLGALATGRAVQWFGIGPAILWTAIVGGCATYLIPLAGTELLLAVAYLSMARFLAGLADMVFVITIVSLRQAIVPIHVQGRVNASVRSIADGCVPLGALLGGLLGQYLGLRTALFVAATIGLVSVFWLWRSPIRNLRDLPPRSL